MQPVTRLDAVRPKKPKRWPLLTHPWGLEADYTEILQALVDRAFAAVRKRMAPVLRAADEEDDRETREDAMRVDAPKPKRKAAVTFEVVVEDLPEVMERAMSAESMADTIRRIGRETDTHNLRAMRRQFSEAVGIQVLANAPELEPAIRDFTQRNLELIKSIPTDVFPVMKEELIKGLNSGARSKELAKVLQDRHGVARRKAEFIARDQVGKLHASLTEQRHKAMGITRYRWRTSRDNRVRKLHREREGKIFEYAKPPKEVPADGHAGMPPRCRCTQEPIIDDVLSPRKAVEVENSTVDPAPPEAPRPPRSRVPVERISDVVKRHEREAAKRRAEAKKKAAKAPAKKTAKKTAPKKPPEPVPIDRSKGWSATKVYRVPLFELADVPAMAWNGREKSIAKAYEAGLWDKMDPIRVLTNNKETGARELADGNHRLAFARKMGLTHINVRFSDRAAASLRARPENPGLPWFIRESPENFGYLFPKKEE